MTDLPDDSKNQPINPTVNAPGGKERVESVTTQDSGETRQEKTPVTEFTRNVDLDPEVEGWLEKLEKEDTKLQQPIADQSTGQVILDDSQNQQASFKVVLPMTKDEVEKGLQHKVVDSIRWLSEWCIRMIKMFGNKVAYRKK